MVHANPITLTFPLSLEEAAMAARELRLYPDPKSVQVEGAGFVPTPFAQTRPELQQALENFRAESSPDDVIPLSPTDANSAGWMTLSDFFERYFDPWQTARAAAGSISSKNARNVRGAVRSFAEWDGDAKQKIDGWPESLPWSGLPMRSITSSWIESFLKAKIKGFPTPADRWSIGSAKSRRGSLGAVLNYAEKVGAIERAPKLIAWARKARKSVELDDDDNPEILAYTDAELGAIYAALPAAINAAFDDGSLRLFRPASPRPKPDGWKALSLAKSHRAYARAMLSELRCLIVLDANCGARAGDLLRFEFGKQIKLDRTPAEIVFAAEKTGKMHRVPLADVTIAHLKALRESPGHSRRRPYLFPHLGNPDPTLTKPPTERSPYDSHTVPIFRRAMQAAGLKSNNYAKPIHSIRKSCTTRFNLWAAANRTVPVGSEITHGKGSDVVSQSYMATWHSLCHSVESIDWPAEFFKD